MSKTIISEKLQVKKYTISRIIVLQKISHFFLREAKNNSIRVRNSMYNRYIRIYTYIILHEELQMETYVDGNIYTNSSYDEMQCKDIVFKEYKEPAVFRELYISFLGQKCR